MGTVLLRAGLVALVAASALGVVTATGCTIYEIAHEFYVCQIPTDEADAGTEANGFPSVFCTQGCECFRDAGVGYEAYASCLVNLATMCDAGPP